MDNVVHRVCLTPTRNESWIISKFIEASRLWASKIIVVDQSSSDGTQEFLQRAPNVDLLINKSPSYDEAHRQRLLIDRARQTPGKRILIALDADEALSANVLNSQEWARISNAAPGTVLRFRWVNILPGFRQAWIPPNPIACGFVDDGSNHTGDRIHSRRVPFPKGAPVIDLEDVVVLHFQYVAWDRVVSKHRWYQAWERLNHPAKSALDIFRQYHHMDGSWAPNELQPLRREWLDRYTDFGIDFRTLSGEAVKWWDSEVLRMLIEHGPSRFRKLDIWDMDWSAFASTVRAPRTDLADPRSLAEKVIHRSLKATQRYRSSLAVRAFERLLRLLGW